jgi:hypothetical protein
MTTKEFSIEAVAGLTTGICLSNFRDIHECAEWVVGHPIWTHEFAEKSLSDRLRKAIYAQHPQLETIDIKGMKPQEVEDAVEKLRLLFGPTLTLTKGSSERTESPIESLSRVAPGKHAIVVETQK